MLNNNKNSLFSSSSDKFNIFSNPVNPIGERPIFFEPNFKPDSKPDFKPDLKSDLKPDLKSDLKPKYKPCIFPELKPDFHPDFSEKFDIVGDSINLALYTLGLSLFEYNSLDIQSLKSQRQIDYSFEKKWALNILIYYKNKSISLTTPIQKNLPNIIEKKNSYEDFTIFEI